MEETVVHRPQAAADQVRLGVRRPRHNGEGHCCEREGDRRVYSLGPRATMQAATVARSQISPATFTDHATALHRKNSPPMATTAPAARSTFLPHGCAWMSPMAMPTPCKQPVAATKPML